MFLSCQSETILAIDENTSSVTMSIFLGIFNLGIGLGSFIGGPLIFLTFNPLDILPVLSL